MWRAQGGGEGVRVVEEGAWWLDQVLRGGQVLRPGEEGWWTRGINLCDRERGVSGGDSAANGFN